MCMLCLRCSSFLEHQSAQALAEAKRTALCRDCIIAVCSRFQVRVNWMVS